MATRETLLASSKATAKAIEALVKHYALPKEQAYEIAKDAINESMEESRIELGLPK